MKINWHGNGVPPYPPETVVRVWLHGVMEYAEGPIRRWSWGWTRGEKRYGSIVAYEVVSPLERAGLGDSQDNLTFGPIDESARRKNQPVMRGCLDYFPDALLAVSELSRIANDKHNPGQPMHWSKGKSNDHADCCVRHLMARGKWDDTMAEPVRHSTSAAWRALANLQMEIELEREKT